MTITNTHIITWLRNASLALNEQKAYLTDLDSAIGDADHGTNIARGFATIVEKLQGSGGVVEGKDIGAILKLAAMTIMSAVGGASGLLYGNFFLKASGTAGTKSELTAQELLQVLESGRDGIVQRGRAELGDKTMIDAWTPALVALAASLQAGNDLQTALTAAVAAAEAGMKSTIPLQARKGRASYLGERSIGHQDPGATSTHLILNALLKSIS